jgi:HD-like signal output (HDOD) protein/CheY-like chemotaxis protein
MNRILFVDDEPKVLSGLRRTLHSRQGQWDMDFAAGGPAALQIMASQPVDVIVSDFRMPGLDGGQLLAEVRRRHPDTARLILSGQTAEHDMIRVVALAHQFLSKPCGPEDLMAAVDRAVRLREELAGQQVRIEMQGFETLPSPSSELHRLIDTLESPGADEGAVAGVLERDATLAATVLQQLNFLFCASASPVRSLEEALTRFGLQRVRSLALWSEISRAFPLPDRVSRKWLGHLHTHALETALLARRLAVPEARDDAFCAGLLHECGQLIFAVCRPDVLSAHLRLRDREARLMVEVERETFGVTHAQAGAHLLSLWGFPLGMIDAAAHHADTITSSQFPRLAVPEAVRLAHAVVEQERIRLCTPAGSRTVDDTVLERAGVLSEVWSWRTERAVRRGRVA